MHRELRRRTKEHRASDAGHAVYPLLASRACAAAGGACATVKTRAQSLVLVARTVFLGLEQGRLLHRVHCVLLEASSRWHAMAAAWWQERSSRARLVWSTDTMAVAVEPQKRPASATGNRLVSISHIMAYAALGMPPRLRQSSASWLVDQYLSPSARLHRVLPKTHLPYIGDWLVTSIRATVKPCV